MEEAEFAVNYQVTLPPGEVGIGFETAFNPDRIVVLKLKPHTFAAEKTSISVGDKLISIDDIAIQDMKFDEVMRVLIECQRRSGCVVTLQTVFEQNRLLRIHALSRLRDVTEPEERHKMEVEMSRV